MQSRSTMMNHTLSALLTTENERNATDSNDNDKRINTDKSMDNTDGATLKRVNSTPIWPTELPDVFSFPESFFELQKDLDHCVMEYLIRMGYADAAVSFKKELIQEKKDTGVFREDNEGETDDEDDEVDDETSVNDAPLDIQLDTGRRADDSRLYIKEAQSSNGIKSVQLRKRIMILILNGEIKESISLIQEKWPFFFTEFPIIELRLLHLQAIEMIRGFFDRDISGMPNEEVNSLEEKFFGEFIEFIRVNLSDSNILKSSRFVKDMELTMGLLSYCKFSNERKDDGMDLPPDLQELLDCKLRETIGIRVNKALLAYVDGIAFHEGVVNKDSDASTGAITDGDTSTTEERYGVGNDDPNDPLLVNGDRDTDGVRVLSPFGNGDARLLQLVKLFVWSYGLQRESSSSSRVRLEKMMSITLG